MKYYSSIPIVAVGARYTLSDPMAYSQQTPGEQGEQSRIGIIIRLFNKSRISFLFIFPT